MVDDKSPYHSSTLKQKNFPLAHLSNGLLAWNLLPSPSNFPGTCPQENGSIILDRCSNAGTIVEQESEPVFRILCSKQAQLIRVDYLLLCGHVSDMWRVISTTGSCRGTSKCIDTYVEMYGLLLLDFESNPSLLLHQGLVPRIVVEVVEDRSCCNHGPGISRGQSFAQPFQSGPGFVQLVVYYSCV